MNSSDRAAHDKIDAVVTRAVSRLDAKLDSGILSLATYERLQKIVAAWAEKSAAELPSVRYAGKAAGARRGNDWITGHALEAYIVAILAGWCFAVHPARAELAAAFRAISAVLHP